MPLPWSLASRMLLAGVLLLASKYHLIQQWVFGTMFSPEMPRAAVIMASWAFCTFALLLLLVFFLEIGVLLTHAFGLRRRFDHTLCTRLRYGAATAAMALAAFGMTKAMQVPKVKTVQLTIPGLPAAMDGYRLVQLSDLHISRLFQAPWVEQVVDRTNALHPDLIVITGDLIDGTTAARANDVKPLSQLQARQGVITSLGNHEYYFDAKRWTAEFERLGMRVLVNQHMVLKSQGGGLVIAGITDPSAMEFQQAGPDIGRALKKTPANNPVILLSHRPIDALVHAAAGVDVQLSGHTHGGMVRGLDLIAGKANDGFVSGLYAVGKMQLYVSNGTGLWNGFPLRLGVPSEITEFILRSPSH